MIMHKKNYTAKWYQSFVKEVVRCKWEYYHWKVIKAGLRAIGNSIWLAATVAIGKMATKSLINQEWGINSAVASIIIPMIAMSEKINEILNLFRTLGTSMKKLDFSTSLAVAPQTYSIRVSAQEL